MPVYLDQLARGRGKFRVRVVIEGWPYILVDDASLVRTTSDGRQQIVGLDPRTLRIAASADLAFARIREQEMTLEVADVRPGRKATLAFAKAPTASTDLADDLTDTATTVEVFDTTGFQTSGVIHIGREAIAYTNKTGTSFTGCTRGYWDTIAQAHFIGDGERLQYPEVTDLPRSLRDRRVYVYLYGSGEPAASAGTRRWAGVARSDLDYEKGIWRFSVEPITRVLEQQLGGDLEEPIPIRGIYLPATGALRFDLSRWDGPSLGGSSALTSDVATIRRSGFWRDNVAICADINTEIAAAVAGWGWGTGADLRAEPVGTQGYRFIYRTASSGTVHYVGISGWNSGYDPLRRTFGREGISPVDAFTRVDGHYGVWLDGAGQVAETLLTDSVYEMIIDAPVPRAWVGRAVAGFEDPSRPENDSGRLYLGGSVVPSPAMLAVVRPEGGEGGDSEETWSEIAEYDATNRWIKLRYVAGGIGGIALGPQSRVRLLRVLARGVDVGGLIDQLVLDSPDFANTGAMPLLGPSDFDPSAGRWDELRDAIASLGLGASRTYVAVGGVTLGELLEEELKLVGCYLALDGQGRMVVKRLDLGLLTDTTVATFDAQTMKGDPPATSKNSEGMLSEVIIRQGWDPEEDRYRGLTIRVRNVTGPSAIGGVLEIRPKSRTGGVIYSDRDPVEVQPEDATTLAQAVLGLFGGPYYTISMEGGLERFEVQIGDSVLVTAADVPNADGSLGVTLKVARVTGYDWSPFEAKGVVHLLAHDRRIGGYAPAFLVSGFSNVSGNRWLVNVSTAAYTSGDATTWFAEGDEVRVVQRNTRTPTRLSGTVFSVSAAALIVDFDGVWSPAGLDWTIGLDRAPNVDTQPPNGRRWAQDDFVFCAGATQRIGFPGGGVRAYEWAP